MDRDWPHQVALPAYRCIGHNYRTMHFFCGCRSFRGHTHSAATPLRCWSSPLWCVPHTQKFLDRFGGELLDPAVRSRWSETRAQPTDFSAERRRRNGRCINLPTDEFAQCFLAIFAACKAATRSGPCGNASADFTRL